VTQATAGKNFIATKVFDDDCDICKHMSKHDRVAFDNFEDIAYQEVKLDDVISHENNLTKLRIYQLLERHCLSPTYEINLPVYLVMTKQGQYKGHLQGALTIQEMRERLKEIFEDNPE